MKLTKQEALAKIGELKKYISEEETAWVKIDYSVIPKEVFDRYGAKPFEIMKQKMRKEDGKVWNYINFNDAKEEAQCRLHSWRQLERWRGCWPVRGVPRLEHRLHEWQCGVPLCSVAVV